MILREIAHNALDSKINIKKKYHLKLFTNNALNK